MIQKNPGDNAAYCIRYGPASHQWLMRRTAENRMSFLLPYLRRGMSLLDCGCGPGSVTLGLAEAVSPGSVVGIDLE